MKNNFITLVVFFIAFFGATYAQEQQQMCKNFLDVNYIKIVGNAEMDVAPDSISITIVLDEKNSITKMTLADAEKKMIDSFKLIGINLAKDLVVEDFSSALQSYFLKKDDIAFSKVYTLTAHDATTVNKVFSILKNLGIPDTRIASVNKSNIEASQQELRIRAVNNARTNAEQLTNAAGAKLGKLLYIGNSDDYPSALSRLKWQRTPSAVLMKKNERDDTIIAPNIDFKKVHLSASINVYFQITQ